MAEEPTTVSTTTTIDMEIEPTTETLSKRSHEEEEDTQNGTESKKQRVVVDDAEEDEKSAEENRVEEENRVDEEEKSGPVELGPKSFVSSVQMFDYFFRMLHHWPQNLRLNTYEHMVVLELLNKGHPEPEKKIGEGVQAFQIRVHPEFKNKCFFIIRNDESVEDFSFRKCIDQILPLPENMRVGERDSGHGGGRGRRGGGGGGGRRGGGRGRGGHFRGGRGRGGKRN